MNEINNQHDPLQMVARGWQLLPCHSVTDDGCCTCGDPHDGEKSDPTSIGKHPRISMWEMLASTDPKQIEKWVRQFGRINWAVACRLSGLMVVDVDPRNGGLDTLRELESTFEGVWPATFTVSTGLYSVGGAEVTGTHYYFQVPLGSQFPKDLGKNSGVDLKYNGYVMAPGSKHASGVSYEVISDEKVALLPAGLKARFTRPGRRQAPLRSASPRAQSVDVASPYGAAALRGEVETIATTPEGARNNQLFVSGVRVGELVAGGELPADSIEVLAEAAHAAGLSPAEVEQVLLRPEGAFEIGHSQPRSAAKQGGNYREQDASAGTIAELLERVGRVDWVDAFSSEWEQEWFIPGFLAAGRGHSLYSDAGLGKSVLIRQACAELVTHRPVLGGKSFARPLKVVYFDHENSVLGDCVPHLKEMGFESQELENLVYLSFPAMGELDTPQGGLEFEMLLEYYQPDLVVMDTVSRTISQDENSNKTWLDFYRYAGGQLKKRKVAYLRLDHSGKVAGRGQRGGSAKKGDVDLVWHLSKTQDKDKLLLTCEKSRVPVDRETIGVIRHTSPFKHSLQGDSSSFNWRVLIEAAEKHNAMKSFAFRNMVKNGKIVGSESIRKVHSQLFKEEGWTKHEFHEAHQVAKREFLGLEPLSHDEEFGLPSE